MRVWGPVALTGSASVPCDTALLGNVISIDNTDENTHTSGMLVLVATNAPATGFEVAIQVQGRATADAAWIRAASWSGGNFNWVPSSTENFVAYGTGFTFHPEMRFRVVAQGGSGNTISPYLMQ